MAQVLATNGGLWITLIGMEAQTEADHIEHLEAQTSSKFLMHVFDDFPFMSTCY